MRNISQGLSLPLTNSHLEELHLRGSLIKVTPLHAILSFLKALNFSLSDFRRLMILEVKNEALERSLNSSRLHLSVLKFSLGSHIMLLAYRPVIKLFSGHYKKNQRTITICSYCMSLPLRRQSN